MKRKVATAFMTVGIIFILIAAVLLVLNNREAEKARQSSESLVESIRQSVAEYELKEDADVTDPFDEEMKVKEIDGYGYIGYLSIPALELDLPVMSEWDYDRLKIAPCRYHGSTKTDNLVIAAHNYSSHFKYIDSLVPGDILIFTDMEAKKHKYKVDAVELLLPTDVDKVKNSNDALILYTCTYSAAERITVRCSYLK